MQLIATKYSEFYNCYIAATRVVNGNLPRVDPIHDSSSSGEGQDGDDDGNMVLEMLAMIAKPEVSESLTVY